MDGFTTDQATPRDYHAFDSATARIGDAIEELSEMLRAAHAETAAVRRELALERARADRLAREMKAHRCSDAGAVAPTVEAEAAQ